MHTNLVNIVVDVKQALSDPVRNELVNEISGKEGVRRAWSSQTARRLVLVDYDPSLTDSHKILDTVVNRGFDARLIGM